MSVAVRSKMSRTWAFETRGSAAKSNAAAPATNPAAMLVPLSAMYSPFAVERMFAPGAAMSM